MQMVHRLVILALLVGGPAFAQDAAPQPVSEVTTVAQAVGRERLVLAARGFVPTGEPVVSDTSRRGESILEAPYRLEREGRLAVDISVTALRMKQDAPVAFLTFRPSGRLQSEPIHAWCGQGQQFDLILSWRDAIVCMVETTEGKAKLVTPELYPASWWDVRALSDAGSHNETDRVEVLPAQTPTEFKLVISNLRVRNDGLTIRSQIVGPSLKADKTESGVTYHRTIPATDGRYSLNYDGLRLTLSPSEDTSRLDVTSERFMPPAEMTFQADQQEVATEQATEDTPVAAGVGATPYVIGALRFDPTNMTAQSGVIGRNGMLVTGRAEYALTGRLTKTLHMTSSFLKETAEVGTAMHQLEVIRRTSFGTLTANRIWCGPIGPGTIFSGKPRNKCIHYGAKGFLEANWPSSSPSWLATSDRMDMPYGGFEAKDFEIEISETPDMAPLDIGIKLHRVTADAAIIRFIATKDGEEAMVYQVTAPFAEGLATVPLWSHQLVLTRSGNGVTAELTNDGDGTTPVLWNMTN